MKANLIIIVITSFFISSCNNKTSSIPITDSNLTTDNKAFELFQQKCYACHSVTTKSHDEIIAPPMVAVKRRYMKEYDSKEDFVKATNATVLDLEKLPVNPLELFGDTPKLPTHTGRTLTTTLSKAFNLGNVQRNTLKNIIQEAYKQKGINASDKNT